MASGGIWQAARKLLADREIVGPEQSAPDEPWPERPKTAQVSAEVLMKRVLTTMSRVRPY